MPFPYTWPSKAQLFLYEPPVSKLNELYAMPTDVFYVFHAIFRMVRS
jgi:hypothetical protein